MLRKTLAVTLFILALLGPAYGANTRPPVIVIVFTYEVARDFHEGLAAVKSRDRWGYIDYLGRIAVPFVHRVPEAGDFSDGFAFVGDHYIDTEGRPAFTRIDEDTDERIERYFTNGLPFSEGLAGVQSGGQWGYIDLMGNYLIAPTFERVGSFVDGLAPARKKGLWGYINVRGVFVIEPKFVKACDFHEGLAAVYVNGRWGYINKEGKYAIRPSYHEAGNFVYGLAPVRTRTNYRGWGYINPRNKFVIPRRYNSAGDFGDGLAPVAGDRRWGYVNFRGEWEIPAQFDDARPFSEGLAAVKREKRWGYIRP
ncbi:MAG: WG repeat-containing protein [Synergistaceae bacterium]|nr:WG repeat-containing protein [Synergistaceae bacterium]